MFSRAASSKFFHLQRRTESQYQGQLEGHKFILLRESFKSSFRNDVTKLFFAFSRPRKGCWDVERSGFLTEKFIAAFQLEMKLKAKLNPMSLKTSVK